MTPDIEGQIGISLRSLLNSNGFSSVKIIGYEVSLLFLPSCYKSQITTYQHNWDNAGAYPVQLVSGINV
jgi:hypothetical protein